MARAGAGRSVRSRMRRPRRAVRFGFSARGAGGRSISARPAGGRPGVLPCECWAWTCGVGVTARRARGMRPVAAARGSIPLSAGRRRRRGFGRGRRRRGRLRRVRRRGGRRRWWSSPVRPRGPPRAAPARAAHAPPSSRREEPDSRGSSHRSVAEQVVEQHPAGFGAFRRGRVVGGAGARAADRLGRRAVPAAGARARERARRQVRRRGISRSPAAGVAPLSTASVRAITRLVSLGLPTALAVAVVPDVAGPGVEDSLALQRQRG